MTSDLVETVRLCKRYSLGGEIIQAVRDVSVTVRRGEFLAIMGASGSGKSTFMNLLGCLDVASSGTISLDGVDVRSLTEDALADLRNRKIGFVFQQFSLLPRTDALTNVALPLVYAGVSRIERMERARLHLEAMGLAGRLRHTPARLSGGQQQRVAIARAMVTEPVLLLADEPTGALDHATSGEILGLLQRLNERGLTIVMVTHDAEVAEHATRLLAFRDGQVVSDDPVRSRRRAGV